MMPNPPPYSLPLAADLFAWDGTFVGYVEGFALASEDSPELYAVARNNLTILTGRSFDPIDQVHYKALTAEANKKKNLEELQLRWEEWVHEKTGEGAKADHLWNQREAS